MSTKKVNEYRVSVSMLMNSNDTGPLTDETRSDFQQALIENLCDETEEVNVEFVREVEEENWDDWGEEGED